jgi:hypothetical protein
MTQTAARDYRVAKPSRIGRMRVEGARGARARVRCERHTGAWRYLRPIHRKTDDLGRRVIHPFTGSAPVESLRRLPVCPSRVACRRHA